VSLLNLQNISEKLERCLKKENYPKEKLMNKEKILGEIRKNSTAETFMTTF